MCKNFFNFFLAILLNSFLFISCSSSASSSSASSSSASCDTPDEIAIKLADSSISECLTETEDLSKAFDDIASLIGMDESIDTIQKFAEELIKFIPTLAETFVGDDFGFSVFVLNGGITIKKKYPNATSEEFRNAFIQYVEAVEVQFMDSIDTIEKFQDEAIKFIPTLAERLDNLKFTDFFNIQVIRFFIKKYVDKDNIDTIEKFQDALLEYTKAVKKEFKEDDFRTFRTFRAVYEVFTIITNFNTEELSIISRKLGEILKTIF